MSTRSITRCHAHIHAPLAPPSYPCNDTKHRNYGQAVRRVADVPQAPGSPPWAVFKPLAEDLTQKRGCEANTCVFLDEILTRTPEDW